MDGGTEELSRDGEFLYFANRDYDIGMFGNFGGMTEIRKTMLISDNRNFASAFKKTGKIAAKEIVQMTSEIAELDY